MKIVPAAAALAFALAAMPDSATAQQPPQRGSDRRIAAIVNRDAITLYDLEQRMRFIALTSRAPEVGEGRKRLLADVLRAMINERLQLQEAARLTIEVTGKEVQDQLAEIERRNRMGPGGLAKALRQRGIDPRTFEDQIRASIAWNKVVQQRILPQIRVSDVEVEAVLKRLKQNKEKLQYRVQEIFLPVDSPAQHARVLQTAQFILAQLRAGASFEILARQFSQTGTASSGGDMGFLFEGQMEPEIERTVKSLKTGQIAGPVRGAGGYYIIRVSDRRTFGGRNPDVKSISVVQGVLRLPDKPTPAQQKEVQAQIAKIAAGVKDCADLIKAVAEAKGIVRRSDDVIVEQQRPAIRALLAPLKVNQVTRPHLEQNTYSVFIRCADDPIGKPPEEKDVREALQRQKLGAFAERFLKELRRSAYIDIRV
ncbi:MAG TPA: peptidylprolyl isomerase [Alphaproteobacteria bacterium]